MRALWKYSTAALNFSRSVFFLSFFSLLEKYIYNFISIICTCTFQLRLGETRAAFSFYKISFSSELHFQMNNGAKRKSAFIIKKRRNPFRLRSHARKTLRSSKGYSVGTHNGRNYFITGITFHVHTLSNLYTYFSQCLLFYCFLFSLCQSHQGNKLQRTIFKSSHNFLLTKLIFSRTRNPENHPQLRL